MSTEAISGQLGMATPYSELVGKSDAEMEAEFADYAELGVSWLRVDFYWGMIEPVKGGGYNWVKLDKIVDLAEKYDIEIIGLLSGKPSWASAGFKTEADAVAYGNFAKAVAEHFADRVDYWEVMNEQNINGIAPADYVRMLKAAYTAIKAVDADDVVISGGLSPAPATVGTLYGAVDYLKAMYAAGAKGYFDAFGFHPYSWPLMPDDSKSWNGWQIMEDGIRATMVAAGDGDLKVWITEMGAPTAGGTNAVSEAQQVQMLQQAVEMAYSYDWTGPILWYSYNDRGNSATDTEAWFGLVGPTGEKKAAYYVFQQYALADDDRVVEVVVDPVLSNSWYYGDQTDNIVVGGDVNNILRGNGGNDGLDGGKGDDLIGGGAGNDVLRGGEGNDTIAGGVGDDTMTGGAGNDVYDFRDNPGADIITDFAKGDIIDLSAMDANTALAGLQTFNFIGSKWLSKAGDLGVYVDAKNLKTYVQMELNGDGKADVTIQLTGALTLTADDFRLVPGVDTPTFVISSNYTGTAGNDRLIGNAKNNVISGLAGNDTIKGGAGDDVLVGHMGNDVLYGGSGSDRFDFNDARYFGYDVIMDFEKGVDKIDLSGADANLELARNQAFNFVGAKWLANAGDVGVYQDANRGFTEVAGYIDGDKKLDFIIKVDGLVNLTADDFIL